MQKYPDYIEMLLIADDVEDRHADPENVYIAHLLSAAVAKAKKRLGRSKKAIDKLLADETELYHVALDAIVQSGHCASIRDTVKIVMEGYMDGGMTVKSAKTAVEILKHFKTLSALREASVDEIAQVKGISKADAEKILEYLRKN